MSGIAKLKVTLDVIANIAVALTAAAVLWHVVGATDSAGRHSNRPGGPLVQDIATSNLTVSLPLLTPDTKPGQAVIIEVTDFECPFCRRYAQEVFPQVKREIVDEHIAGYAVLQLPLEKIHPNAMAAARVAHCASEEGRFWEAHDLLFGEALLGPNTVEHVQSKLMVNPGEFRNCMATSEQQVRHDMGEARRLGASGTPVFFIGRLLSSQEVLLKGRINGAAPMNILKSALGLAAPR